MALADRLTATEYAALPQALKDAGAYKSGPKAEDGAETWVLDSPEATGLALKLKAKDETIGKLQRDAEDAKRRLDELGKRFEGIDPEAARAAAEIEAERERGEYIKKNDIPGLLEAERKKWSEAQAKKWEEAQAREKALEDDLNGLLVVDAFRRQIVAGSYTEGKEKRDLPRVLPEYADVAEDHYLRRFKPRVITETENGSRTRRAIVTVDGVDKDMLSHLRDEFLPAVRDTMCQQPQHEGAHDIKTRPAREGSPGSPQEIPRDQAHSRISDLASGKVFVDLAG